MKGDEMRDTNKIKVVKARARRANNLQWPLLRGLSKAEIQHVIDKSRSYEVVVCMGEKALKYNG
jgi:hypothetical protein